MQFALCAKLLTITEGGNMKSIGKVLAALILIVMLNVAADAQRRRAAQPGRSKGTSSAPAKRTGSIAIQAGLVYTMGGAQPVARVQFYLLDEDLEEILRRVEVRPRIDAGDNISFVDRYSLATVYPMREQVYLEACAKEIQPHIRQSITTDFNGNGRFNAVPVGTYYLMGITKTRKGYAVWNLAVEVKPGENQIILDQNNAATAL
jgi:hypothetical protein